MVRKQGEKSFSLFETLIALSLIVTVVLELSSMQGSTISLNIYSRNMTKALWLAKSVAAKVEYLAKFYPLKEFKIKEKGKKFDPFFCSKDCPFLYNLTIQDWDLPLIDLIMGGSGLKSEDQENKPDPMMDMIKSQIKKYFDNELLKVALVEVYWSEGARRDSVTIPYLLTNQFALDNIIDSQVISDDSQESKPEKSKAPKASETKESKGTEEEKSKESEVEEDKKD